MELLSQQLIWIPTANWIRTSDCIINSERETASEQSFWLRLLSLFHLQYEASSLNLSLQISWYNISLMQALTAVFKQMDFLLDCFSLALVQSYVNFRELELSKSDHILAISPRLYLLLCRRTHKSLWANWPVLETFEIAYPEPFALSRVVFHMVTELDWKIWPEERLLYCNTATLVSGQESPSAGHFRATCTPKTFFKCRWHHYHSYFSFPTDWITALILLGPSHVLSNAT